jgi:hypothetical protein
MRAGVSAGAAIPGGATAQNFILLSLGPKAGDPTLAEACKLCSWTQLGTDVLQHVVSLATCPCLAVHDLIPVAQISR